MFTKKLTGYSKVILSLVILTVLLNIIGLSKAFCTWYANNVYPILNAILGTLTNVFPFALGEILMYIGALMLVVLLISVLLFIFLHKKEGYKKYMAFYAKVCLLTIVIFLFSYTTNWFIPIRGYVLTLDNTRTEYSADELEQVRNMIVTSLNKAALSANRDSEGHIIFDYTQDEIIDLMRSNSYRFPRLKGHYSHLKPALCSDILEWMNIGGYNYIYTMEPTYNSYCDPLFVPLLLSHELCHHKGYYLENEAEFLSTVILSESDNAVFQYIAYLEMLGYIDDAYFDALYSSYLASGDEAVALEASLEHYREQPSLLPIISEDLAYLADQRQQKYEENVNEFMEENLKEVSEEVADTGWQVQGDLLKENTYSGVTLMLLQYYIKE